MQENFILISLKTVREEKAYQIFGMAAIKNTCVSDQNFYIKRLMINGRTDFDQTWYETSFSSCNNVSRTRSYLLAKC